VTTPLTPAERAAGLTWPPPIPGNLKLHRYCKIFPQLEGKPLRELKEGIEANGLQEPLTLLAELHDGDWKVRLLDGQNRWLACHATRNPDKYLRFIWFREVAKQGIHPLRWVKAKNLSRRHLTANQRKHAAAVYYEELQDLGYATSRRQAAAAETNRKRAGDALPTPGTDADTSTPPAGRARDVVAAEFQTSPSGVQDTVRILRHGVDGLADAHRDSLMSTDTAVQTTRLPEADQRAVLQAAQAAATPIDARRAAREALEERRTLAPEPDVDDPADLTQTAPPDRTDDGPAEFRRTVPTPTSATSTTEPATPGPFWGLPSRGDIAIDRNALDVLLAVARGDHDHPHRAEAITAIELTLSHSWTAA